MIKWWRKRRLVNILSKINLIDPSHIYVTYNSEEEEQQAYDLRNDLVQEAILVAKKMKLPAGYIVHDPICDLMPRDTKPPKWNPQWGVVAVIELPTGQISWHLDTKGMVYDGHDNATKWDRVRKYINCEV